MDKYRGTATLAALAAPALFGLQVETAMCPQAMTVYRRNAAKLSEILVSPQPLKVHGTRTQLHGEGTRNIDLPWISWVQTAGWRGKSGERGGERGKVRQALLSPNKQQAITSLTPSAAGLRENPTWPPL
ncbi:hypothetical protein RRG08_066301 [Elysia crispata]|uniref:Uncharacterized protein n=1 Tax=Elysia crispata TaxID=231223 RepID=A0AAE1E1X4_9GAST|nr:hypothetical protein RRG08_066301 [Elysia crispata]